MPPHLCFNLGSMGFLSPFEYESMKEEVRRIMSGGMKVSLRMRLSARIIRDDQTSEAFHALNEIVIDRGALLLLLLLLLLPPLLLLLSLLSLRCEYRSRRPRHSAAPSTLCCSGGGD